MDAARQRLLDIIDKEKYTIRTAVHCIEIPMWAAKDFPDLIDNILDYLIECKDVLITSEEIQSSVDAYIATEIIGG